MGLLSRRGSGDAPARRRASRPACRRRGVPAAGGGERERAGCAARRAPSRPPVAVGRAQIRASCATAASSAPRPSVARRASSRGRSAPELRGRLRVALVPAVRRALPARRRDDGDAVCGVALHGRPLRHGPAAEAHRDGDRGRRDRSRHVLVPVVRASRHVLAGAVAAAYPRGRAPATAFVNGLPPKSTGSTSERLAVSVPHFNTADGRPRLRYRIDGRAWRGVPRRKVAGHGPAQARLAQGRRPRLQRGRSDDKPVHVAGRAAPGCGRVPGTLLGAAAPRLHRPPDAVGLADRPRRPLQRAGARAVDIYDIDGFLTTRAEVRLCTRRGRRARSRTRGRPATSTWRGRTTAPTGPRRRTASPPPLSAGSTSASRRSAGSTCAAWPR